MATLIRVIDVGCPRTGIGAQSNEEGGCEFILYRHLPKLVELLNIDSLRMFLIAEEFLSDDDMEKLNPHPPHYVGSQIVETLVKLVRKKGQRGLEKFLSALRKSANAGNQPGHEELLQLLETQNECKEGSSVTQSDEVNASQKETGDNDLQSIDQVPPVVQILEECHDGQLVSDLEGPLEEPEVNQRSAGRQKCSQCCVFVLSGCFTLAGIIFCLGLGVSQLTIGVLGAAASDSVNSTYYCGTLVFPFHLCMGGLLSSSGLLICILLVWVAIKEMFPNIHKCVYYATASIVAVFVIVLVLILVVSVLSGIVVFFITAVNVLRIFTSISTYYCNTITYYWAFTEIVIVLSLIGLVIIVLIVATIVSLFFGTVSWLTK